MKQISLFLICLFLSLNAIAICPKQDIKIVFKKKYGKVNYNFNLSRKEFAKYSPTPLPRNVRGLTIGKLDVSYQAKGAVFPYQKAYCAGVTEIDFYIGYDDFKVFIDKRYKRNTCEHIAVKEHEDEHVIIFNEGLKFFAPDVQKAIKKAVKNLRPETVYSEARAQQVFDKQAKAVLKDIQPLLKHVNKKIREKQALIDTDASYLKVQKKCRHW